MGWIYKITNDVNDKIYVGQTFEANPMNRWKNHLHDRKKRKVEKRPLYEAMNKYGVEHFHFEIIEEVDSSLLAERECYWIEELHSYIKDNGYNATLGGDGTSFIEKEEIDKMIQLWKEGNTLLAISRIVHREPKTIKRHLLANKVCKEEDIPIRCAQSHQKYIETTKKAIIQLNKDGEVLKEFDSVTECSEYLSKKLNKQFKTVMSGLIRCCQGRTKTAYGYKWEYKKK